LRRKINRSKYRARARQNPPKEKQAIFEQNEEFHVSTSQK